MNNPLREDPPIAISEPMVLRTSWRIPFTAFFSGIIVGAVGLGVWIDNSPRLQRAFANTQIEIGRQEFNQLIFVVDDLKKHVEKIDDEIENMPSNRRRFREGVPGSAATVDQEKK